MRRPTSVAGARRLLAAAIGLVVLALLAISRRGHAPPPAAVTCAALSDAAKRGKLIFRRGVTSSGKPIEGRVGGGPAVLTGREAACAGCHTPSGAGADEGGVTAPPITAEHLFTDARDRGARARRAYTDATLAAAVREGRSSSSRPLGLVMPRYPLDDSDLEDLTTYLHCVGHDRDPGVTAETLTFGAALPLSGPLAGVGAEVRAVLVASFADVDAEGGIFGRRLALKVEDSGGGGAQGAASAHDRLVDAGVFALVGSVWSGEPAAGSRAREDEVPLVAPVGPVDVGSGSAGPAIDEDGPVFHLHAGPDVLARVAVKHLVGPAGSARPRVLVAHPQDRAGEAWLRGARAEAARRGLVEPIALSFAAGRLSKEAVIEAARQGGASELLLAGASEDLDAGASALVHLPNARIHAPGHLLAKASEARWASVRERVFFVEPALGGEERGPALAAFHAFLQRHALPAKHIAVAARARVAALVLIEALKRAGAHVTREGLVAALETFRDFDAGLVPPLSYGKGRHVGVLGASLFHVGARAGSLVRASAWIGVAP